MEPIFITNTIKTTPTETSYENTHIITYTTTKYYQALMLKPPYPHWFKILKEGIFDKNLYKTLINDLDIYY